MRASFPGGQHWFPKQTSSSHLGNIFSRRIALNSKTCGRRTKARPFHLDRSQPGWGSSLLRHSAPPPDHWWWNYYYVYQDIVSTFRLLSFLLFSLKHTWSLIISFTPWFLNLFSRFYININCFDKMKTKSAHGNKLQALNPRLFSTANGINDTCSCTRRIFKLECIGCGLICRRMASARFNLPNTCYAWMNTHQNISR